MPKVLYVEDTDTMQRMYSIGLAKEGFEVTVAPTGGQALARVGEQSFDVIVLDMMLSGMSGLDFLNAYKQMGMGQGTLVVGLSNVDNPSVVERAKSAGVAEYLLKADYEPKALSDRLKQLLAARPAQPAQPTSTVDAPPGMSIS